MADIHGSPGGEAQGPAAPNPGPAPVPYAGPDQGAANVTYAVTAATFGLAGDDVMQGVTGNAVQESGYAHDVNAGLVTPFYAGGISPIYVGGDADAGGRDSVSGTVAGAVTAAEARYLELEGDTHAQGSTIGDIMTLPPSPLDPGVGTTGVTDPAGGYYDPPRGY